METKNIICDGKHQDSTNVYKECKKCSYLSDIYTIFPKVYTCFGVDCQNKHFGFHSERYLDINRNIYGISSFIVGDGEIYRSLRIYFSNRIVLFIDIGKDFSSLMAQLYISENLGMEIIGEDLYINVGGNHYPYNFSVSDNNIIKECVYKFIDNFVKYPYISEYNKYSEVSKLYSKIIKEYIINRGAENKEYITI